MYPRPKSGSVVPSDAQAKEKLALYVYEYLLHVGAQKAAATFLNEIRWDKNITLGESPGFLHSWWCVFWDLYCAAPERRDTNEHSTEAKVFHEYGFVPNTAGAGPGAPPPFAPPNGYIHNPQPGGLPPGPQDGPLTGGPPGFPFHMTGQPMPGGPGGMGNCMDARGPPGGPQGPGSGSNQGPPANMIQHGGPPGPLGPGGMGHQRLTQTPPTQMTQMAPRMLVNPGPPNGPPGGPGFGGPYGGGVNCSPLPPGPSNMSPLPTGGPPGRGPGGGPSGQQYSSASPVTFAGPGTPGQGGPGMGPGSQDGEYMMRHGLPPGMQAGQGGPQQGGPGSMAFMGGPGGPDGGMMASEMGHLLNGMESQFESMKQSPRHPMMGGGPGSRGDDPGAMYSGMYSELQSMQSMQSMQALAGMQPPNAANGASSRPPCTT